MRKPPEIVKIHLLAKTRLFKIEQVDLRFSNGATRQFERLSPFTRQAVMVVPILDSDTFLLTREYSTGVEQYTLGFPKGLVDGDESLEEAANREIMEEMGYGAKKLTPLIKLSLAPAFMRHTMQVYLGEELFEKRLEGDEPEVPEVVPWKFSEMSQLLERPDFTEARSVAALFKAKEYLGAKE